MPATGLFANGTRLSQAALRSALLEETLAKACPSLGSSILQEGQNASAAGQTTTREEIAAGRLVGGNLSTLAALVGSGGEPFYQYAVLALEDVGDAPYRIDRMLTSLSLSLRRKRELTYDSFPGTHAVLGTSMANTGDGGSPPEIDYSVCTSTSLFQTIGALLVGDFGPDYYVDKYVGHKGYTEKEMW